MAGRMLAYLDKDINEADDETFRGGTKLQMAHIPRSG
jgi:hypothetical protein